MRFYAYSDFLSKAFFFTFALFLWIVWVFLFILFLLTGIFLVVFAALILLSVAFWWTYWVQKFLQTFHEITEDKVVIRGSYGILKDRIVFFSEIENIKEVSWTKGISRRAIGAAVPWNLVELTFKNPVNIYLYPPLLGKFAKITWLKETSSIIFNVSEPGRFVKVVRERVASLKRNK